MFANWRVRVYLWRQAILAAFANEQFVAVFLAGSIVVLASISHLVSAGTVVASDAFSRSVSGGWGTADLGGAYTLSGTASDFNVNGSSGTMTKTSGGTRVARLDGMPVQDTDIKVKISTDKLASGSSLYTGMLARHVAGGDHYRFQMRYSTGQDVFLKVSKFVSDVDTAISSEYQDFGLTHAAGSYIWMRAQAFGTNPTTLKLKAWADGQSEPSTWLITTTDSEAGLQASGSAGMRSYSSAGFPDYPVTFSFDDFTLIDGVDPEPPPPDPGPPPTEPYTYASDLFERESTDTWDVADTGGTYTMITNPADYDVNGEEGTMNVTASGTDDSRQARLDGLSVQDTEVLARVKVDQIAATDNAYAYLSARHVPAGAEYRARIKFRPNGNYDIQAATATNVTSGSDTEIGTAVSKGAYSPNSYIWVRMQLIGTNPTTINMKAWPDGQGEPRNWDLAETDSTPALQAAGSAGLTARTSDAQSNLPLLYTFDDFQVTNIITDSYPPGVPPPPLPGTEFYVSPSGHDTNPGTIDEPWRTLKYSLTQIAPGQTLTMRGGTYNNEGGSIASFAGTSTDQVTIRSYPGERAVIDGAIPEFLTPDNNAWELVDGTIGLYRSVRSDFQGNDLAGNSATVSAWLTDYETQLTHYGSTKGNISDSINSTNYTLNGFDPIYTGPGVQLRGDGHLYIRLTQNPNDLTDKDGNPISPIPASTNPNDNSLAISTTSALVYVDGSSYVTFKDIDFKHADFGLRMRSGTNNITVDNCNFIYGWVGMEIDDAVNVEVKNSDFIQGVPDTSYWSDIKGSGSETANGNPEFGSNAIAGTLSGWNIHDSTFRNGTDGLQVKEGTTNLSAKNNSFLNNRDDVAQIRTNVSNVELAYNLMRHVHNGYGVQRSTGGTKGPIYFHHNVMDVSEYQRIGRPGNARGPEYGTWTGSSPFEGHGSGDDDQQLKFYNNTIVGRKGRSNNSLGPRMVEATPELYVYNNLWYAIGNVPALSNHQEASGAHYEGDVFWQPNSTEPLFSNFGNSQNYTNLTAYKAASGLNWENNALQIDPGFNLAAIDSTDDSQSIAAMWEIYRPTNQQLGVLGASYSGLNWPGVAGVNYTGALAPPTLPPSPPPPTGGGSGGSGGSGESGGSGGSGNPSTPILSATSNTTHMTVRPNERLEWKTSITGGVQPYSIDWGWGDGVSDGKNLSEGGEVIGSHTYNKVGNYQAKIIITDNAGQTTQLTLEVTVQEDPSQPVGNNNGPAATTTSNSPITTITTFIGDTTEKIVQNLENVVRQLPKPVAVSLPYFPLPVLLGAIALLLLQSQREIAESRRLSEFLRRAKQLVDEKNGFIQLASHYLRTPYTIIQGGIDMIASSQPDADPVSVDKLQGELKDFRADIENVLGAASTDERFQTISSQNAKVISNHRPWMSPAFLVPVVLAAAFMTAGNILVDRAHQIPATFFAIFTQVTMFVAVSIGLYVALRGLRLHRRDKVRAQAQHDQQVAIDEARNRLIREGAGTLSGHVQKIQSLLSTVPQGNAGVLIDDGIKRMNEVLQRFRMTATVAPPVTSAPFTQFYMSGLMSLALKSSLENAKQKNVTISQPPQLVLASQQPEWIAQILGSVIDNAVAYSPDKSSVEITASEHGHKAVIEVKDHGTGVEPEKLKQLFQPFTKAEGALQFDHAGLGLSLYLDRLLLSALDGSITMESKPNDGSLVKIAFPIK